VRPWHPASNAIAPQHEGVDLGIGDATLIKALAEATGRQEKHIREEYKEEGDLGIVAMSSRRYGPHCSLTVHRAQTHPPVSASTALALNICSRCTRARFIPGVECSTKYLNP